MNFQEACLLASELQSQGMGSAQIAKALVDRGYEPRKGKVKPITARVMASKGRLAGGERRKRPFKRKANNGAVGTDVLTILTDVLSSNMNDETKRKVIERFGVRI